MSWYDIDDEVLRRVELLGLDFEVVGSLPASDSESDQVSEPDDGSRDMPRAVLLAISILGFAVWLPGWLWRRLSEWRAARRDSEPTHFRRVRSVIRGGDPRAITAAIMAWLDRLDPGPRPARLDLFLREFGDETSRASAADLDQCFADRRGLTQGLRNARRRFLQKRRGARAAEGVLPELNGPGSG